MFSNFCRLAALSTLVFVLSACLAAPAYRGEAKGNFDGDEFRNTIASTKTLWDIAKLFAVFEFKKSSWPKSLPVEQRKPLHERYSGEGVSALFINHSTVLLQFNGINVLTDPIFAERASPFSFAGPKRVRKPGVKLKDLPPIDVILISHNHYDHLDIASLKAIVAQQPESPPIILSGLGNGALLTENGLTNFHDLAWGQSYGLSGVEFIFTECRHRSGRGLADQMKTLWGSFAIKSPNSRIYFAGDTGYGPHFIDAGDRHGPFDLALLPIGAYEPRWFMDEVHVNPEEAVQASLDLRARQSMAVHFGTFQLTYEKVDDPKIALESSLDRHGIARDKFWVAEFGAERIFP